MFRRRSRHTSKALIRQHLEDSDVEDSDEQDTTGPETLPDDSSISRWTPAEDLSSCTSWLDRLCKEEQARLEDALEIDIDWAACQSNINAVGASGMREHAQDKGADCLDTRILQRIRQGRGPRDTVGEDLLAVFRDGSSGKNGPESYEEMKELLLSWNERVSKELGEDGLARAVLGTAVAKRSSLLRKFDPSIDREKALEESSTKLLQALTCLRPEIADFRHQESIDILTMMWANVGVATPDLDDELKLLTMKALINEVESISNTKNAEKLSGLARSLTLAQLEGNDADIERLKAKTQAFEQKLRENAIRKVIDRIKAARRELTQAKLVELQELTELQAGQKWAAHVKLSGSQYMQNLSNACDQANGKLQQTLQQQAPELDAHVQVVQNNANGLASMSAGLVTRAEEAGFSLKHDGSSPFFDLAKANIKAYVSGAVADIVNARAEATKMLDRMGTVERHLDALLDAAKRQYWAYDDVLRVLEEAVPFDVNSDKESELAERYGPRRESILLMARDTKRVKYD